MSLRRGIVLTSTLALLALAGASSAPVLAVGQSCTSVTPSYLAQGVDGQTLRLNGSYPTSSPPETVSFSPADGITIVSTTKQSTSLIEVVVDVTATASSTARDVMVNQVTSTTCANKVTIGPEITGVGAAVSNTDQTATITVDGRGFQQGASINIAKSAYGFGSAETDTLGGGDVTVTPTNLRATFPTLGVAPGRWKVTVINPNGGSFTFGNGTTTGQLVTGGVPAVSALTPSAIAQSATDSEYTVSGSNLARGALFTISGSGVRQSAATTWVGLTSVRVKFTADADAALGPRDVTVTNTDGQAGSAAGALSVVARAPTLTSIAPSAGDGGTSVDITDLKGTDFQPDLSAALERQSQPSIPMTNVTRVSDTKVTGTFDLANAAPGRWSVRLTNPDGGSALLPNAFEVRRDAPTVTEVTPTNVAQTTTGLKMSIKGTGFAPGFTASLPDADRATITEAVLIGPTLIEAKISVDTNAPLGSRDVKVTNADAKFGICNACFFVVDGPQPQLLSSFTAYGSFDNGGFVGAGDVDGTLENGAEIVTGANTGGSPHVKIFRTNRDTGVESEVAGFHAYAPAFQGGVRVAVGDVDGDPSNGSEIVTAPGPGGGPHIRVFRVNADRSITEPLGGGFMAYTPEFAGGAYVAAGDIDGDGGDEIIVGAGPGGGPHVRIMKFDPLTNRFDELTGFYAYAQGFSGGVAVGAGNVVPEDAGPAKLEAITAPASGGGPHVRLYNQLGRVVREFMAFPQTYTDGVRVASGDLDFDTVDDVIVGKATRPEVAMFTDDPTRGFTLLVDPPPAIYGPNAVSGTNVASFDMDGDGDDDLVTAPDHRDVVIVRVTRPL